MEMAMAYHFPDGRCKFRYTKQAYKVNKTEKSQAVLVLLFYQRTSSSGSIVFGECFEVE